VRRGRRNGRGEKRAMGAVVVAGEDVGCGRRGCETRRNGKETEGQTDERKEGRKKETEGAGGMLFRKE